VSDLLVDCEELIYLAKAVRILRKQEHSPELLELAERLERHLCGPAILPSVFSAVEVATLIAVDAEAIRHVSHYRPWICGPQRQKSPTLAGLRVHLVAGQQPSCPASITPGPGAPVLSAVLSALS